MNSDNRTIKPYLKSSSLRLFVREATDGCALISLARSVAQHCTTIASVSGVRIKILFELPSMVYACTCEIGSNKDFRPTGTSLLMDL